MFLLLKLKKLRAIITCYTSIRCASASCSQLPHVGWQCQKWSSIYVSLNESRSFPDCAKENVNMAPMESRTLETRLKEFPRFTMIHMQFTCHIRMKVFLIIYIPLVDLHGRSNVRFPELVNPGFLAKCCGNWEKTVLWNSIPQNSINSSHIPVW